MKNYKFKVVESMSSERLELAFQKILNDMVDDGWALQEFHTSSKGSAATIQLSAVFYKDVD